MELGRGARGAYVQGRAKVPGSMIYDAAVVGTLHVDRFGLGRHDGIESNYIIYMCHAAGMSDIFVS